MFEKIHPWYITGFTNADGCFSIHVEKSKISKYDYRLKPLFTVTQHEKSKETLHDIQNYFQCGKCIPQHKNCINYTVSSRVDLYNSIIPHFSRYPNNFVVRYYPLQSQKYRQYRQWLDIVRRIEKREHWTPQGFVNIINVLKETSQKRAPKLEFIIDSMYNRFGVLPQEINLELCPEKQNKNQLKPEFISGFVDGDGSFCISHRKTGRVDVCFSIVATRESFPLLLKVKKYFGVGNVYNPSEETSRYMVWKASAFLDVLEPHFSIYPLRTEKKHDWARVFTKCREICYSKKR